MRSKADKMASFMYIALCTTKYRVASWLNCSALEFRASYPCSIPKQAAVFLVFIYYKLFKISTFK